MRVYNLRKHFFQHFYLFFPFFYCVNVNTFASVDVKAARLTMFKLDYVF